jgi:hypothetical protein
MKQILVKAMAAVAILGCALSISTATFAGNIGSPPAGPNCSHNPPWIPCGY